MELMTRMRRQSVFTFTLFLYLSYVSVASGCPSLCRCSNTSVYCLYKEMKTNDLVRIAPYIPTYSTKLFLSGNNFDEFPIKALKNLKKLEYLALSFNKLKSVPQNISHYFPRLKELYLTANEIRDLKRLTGYENLRTLNLDQNLIEEIPPFTFKDVKNLKELLLGQNNIRRIFENSFSGLERLEHLQLNNNQLELIDETAFRSNRRLTEIYLHVNKLGEIQNGLFSHLKELQTLYLYDNRISRIGSRAFQGLTVKTIYLSSNKIKYVPKQAFQNITVKNRIYMHDNPFQCDCQLIMVSKTSLKKLQNDKKIMLGACASPHRLVNKGVFSLNSETNNCTICDLNPCGNELTCSADKNDSETYQCIVPVVTTVSTTISSTVSTTTSSTVTRKISSTTSSIEVTFLKVAEQREGEQSKNQNNKKTNKTLHVITGVCIAVGCAIAVLIGWLLYQRRKKKEFEVNNRKNGHYDNVKSCQNALIDLKNVTPTKESETKIFINDGGECV
ncbi:slit homolog 1 protein-like [Hydractinia symbiolongicarpus]|uniref:slit homolog 1 protein-like n=1 Tax=Hydractinia symbiolongicarpus TaxID=13093 RepID=UPI00254FC502|nr:slit homolog 1 protein-like [Hydractinia symbiolongicarpus]